MSVASAAPRPGSERSAGVKSRDDRTLILVEVRLDQLPQRGAVGVYCRRAPDDLQKSADSDLHRTGAGGEQPQLTISMRLVEHRSVPGAGGDRRIVGVAFQQQVPQRTQQAGLRREGAVDGLQRYAGFDRDVVDGRRHIAVALEQKLRGLEDGEPRQLGLLTPALRVVGPLGPRRINHLTSVSGY